MQDLLGPGTLLGYCTNVHAGADLDQVRANLARYSLAVKKVVSPDAPMGIGLWFSAATARRLADGRELTEFSDWLSQHGLLPFTLNGFPYGDFHGPVVKLDVYEPDWRSPRRVAYTTDLINVLAVLLELDAAKPAPAGPGDHHGPGGPSPPPPREGSISTLPIAWGGRGRSPRRIQGGSLLDSRAPLEGWAFAVEHLAQTIDYLRRIEQESGRLIHLDLEPEPGCVLQTTADAVDFFENHLDRVSRPEHNRRYLRVCFDTSHSAVMFEDTESAIGRLEQAGVKIGKVQIASALAADFQAMDPGDRPAAVATLRRFQEDRYLHQTLVRNTNGSGRTTTTLHDDLPDALNTLGGDQPPTGCWRVHYHVPLFLDRIGLLETTRDHAVGSLKRLAEQTLVRHFEIETYAWGVLPQPLATTELSDGIAREITWLIDHVTGGGSP